MTLIFDSVQPIERIKILWLSQQAEPDKNATRTMTPYSIKRHNLPFHYMLLTITSKLNQQDLDPNYTC